jgi:hypothetical protein
MKAWAGWSEGQVQSSEGQPVNRSEGATLCVRACSVNDYSVGRIRINPSKMKAFES